METAKELIRLVINILERVYNLIDKQEQRNMLYGVPVNYCTNEMLDKYIHSFEKVDALSASYDHAGIRMCNIELKQRSAYGIKIVKDKK